MTRFPKRLTTCLLLAAYLCASTVGGLLHSHEHGLAQQEARQHAGSGNSHQHHHEHQHPSHAHAGHAHRHAEHHHAGNVACTSDTEDSTKSSDSPQHQHHDDCTVCRFLGQVSLPAQIAPADMPLGLSAEAPAALIAAPSYGIARATLHLRAGPTAV